MTALLVKRYVIDGGLCMADNKKQIPLRISESLYNELARWADDEFRSVNGQIEYLLTECVKKRRKRGGGTTDFGDKENK